ncbi:conserved unknown protein [Ectocarpus siliculosus]|uniref:Phosphoserine phosphatase n=1 Tax=Ectocarpus siliculosus TaxID=2880 RepID=D7FU90_ECTSI|nr:conserved unknown protein [Ectocarpus siliculosus]|eukprot:CBJ31617.1 conserved unknown protein [Ectocarpus siliculosus]
MSPDQKRQLVHLIKDNNPDARTLAVGDGANDVPMIQAAHVGVGKSAFNPCRLRDEEQYFVYPRSR